MSSELETTLGAQTLAQVKVIIELLVTCTWVDFQPAQNSACCVYPAFPFKTKFVLCCPATIHGILKT